MDEVLNIRQYDPPVKRLNEACLTAKRYETQPEKCRLRCKNTKNYSKNLAIRRSGIRVDPKDSLCASVQIFLNVSPKVIKLFSFLLSLSLKLRLLTNNLKEALL